MLRVQTSQNYNSSIFYLWTQSYLKYVTYIQMKAGGLQIHVCIYVCDYLWNYRLLIFLVTAFCTFQISKNESLSLTLKEL